MQKGLAPIIPPTKGGARALGDWGYFSSQKGMGVVLWVIIAAVLLSGGYVAYKMSNRIIVKITPSAGTVVRAGDTIQIKIETTGGKDVKGVLLSVGLASEGLGSAQLKSEALEGPGPFSIPYKIPKHFIGKLYISAEAVVAEDESYFSTTFVMVQPIAPIVSITVGDIWNELTLQINSRLGGGGVWYLLSVYAQLANGDEVDISSSRTGTSFSLLRPSRVVSRLVPNGSVVPVVASDIIAVSPDGTVEALGVGQDTVLISNSGFSTAVIVTVTTGQKEIKPQVTVPADWKTYRNEKYGFEFSYSNDWKVVDDFAVGTDSPFERAEIKVLSPSQAVHFRVVSQADNPYFSEQIQDTEQIFIGNIRAFQTRPFTPANDYGVEEGDFLVTLIYAMHKYFYTLSYGIAIKGNDKSHEDTLLARRILSTFRFTK